MNTERNSYTEVNESFFSLLTLVLGLGLFLIISIETFIFTMLGDSDVLNQESEWYDVIEGLPYTLIFFTWFFLLAFYLARWQDNFSVSPSYHYPSFFGSKIFRRIMRVLGFVHGFTFMNSYGVAGGLADNFERGMVTSHAVLFSLVMILISRLIERDNKSATHE